MKFIGNTEEYLHLTHITTANRHLLKEVVDSSLSVLWFESGGTQLVIDGIAYTFEKNQIIFLTPFHQIKIQQVSNIRLLRFNKPFYCILDHDHEVGCKGMLFFGASELPIIRLPEEELEKFETVWKMFVIEMDSSDNLQIEMLQMMLKRYLILCTRLYKSQKQSSIKKYESDLIRTFNLLVEEHFKTKHTVAEYAALLHKSPKTLSNVFSKIGKKTPLRFIQERKMLEARRLLFYTDMQVQEVAYELGYDDIQAFSRFFKKQEGVSPSKYKERKAAM
ncbi:MAG: AraC family transcriptional regulator [Bacteroidota bacterium]